MHIVTRMQTPHGRRRLAPWVGPWLQERREQRGDLSREEIARRLDRDLSAVVRMESGRSAIPADDLPLFLAVYEVTAGQFAAKARTVKAAA